MVFQVMKFPIMSVHFASVSMKMICHQQDDYRENGCSALMKWMYSIARTNKMACTSVDFVKYILLNEVYIAYLNQVNVGAFK